MQYNSKKINWHILQNRTRISQSLIGIRYISLVSELLSSNLSGWYILTNILYFAVTSFKFVVTSKPSITYGSSFSRKFWGERREGEGEAGEGEGGRYFLLGEGPPLPFNFSLD